MSSKTASAAESAAIKTKDLITSEEISAYTGSKSAYFQRVFDEMDKKKTTSSWNWAAFFFASPWLIFRKMYKQGLILFAVFFALNAVLPVAFLVDQGKDMVSLVKEYRNGDISDEEFRAQAFESDRISVRPYFAAGCALSACILAIHIYIALKANSMYKKKVLADISASRKEAGADKLMGVLAKKGGTSFSKLALICVCYALIKLLFIAGNLFYYYNTLLNGII